MRTGYVESEGFGVMGVGSIVRWLGGESCTTNMGPADGIFRWGKS
jgi:hypothetical protein